MSLIQAQNIDVSYGRSSVLSDINLTVSAGEIVTIVGPNGSGKSSLVRVLIGALKPTKGRVIRTPGLRIGYVPQKLDDLSLIPMTVLRFIHLSGKKDIGSVSKIADKLGISAILDRQISDLSGGETQRVLLAQALLCNPHILVLDEATQGLDQPATAAFYRLIEDVRRDINCAVLMISHDLHVVMSASDRVICLNGHICCEGTPTVVSAAPAYRALFGEGTGGALALYRHDHDHSHDHSHGHSHDHTHEHDVQPREDHSDAG